MWHVYVGQVSVGTHQCQWVAQQDEAWGVVGQLVCEALYVGVDFIVYWSNFKRLLVDLVWRAFVSATRVRGALLYSRRRG
jgi:hypothetical protein